MDRGEIKSESESFKPIVEKFELFALEQGVSLEQVRQFDYFVMHDSTNTGQHVILIGVDDPESGETGYLMAQVIDVPQPDTSYGSWLQTLVYNGDCTVDLILTDGHPPRRA